MGLENKVNKIHGHDVVAMVAGGAAGLIYGGPIYALAGAGITYLASELVDK